MHTTTLPALALAAALAALPPLSAQTTFSWDGGANGTGTSWATGTNWALDSVPTSSATNNLLFDSATGTGFVGGSSATSGTITVSGARTFGTLTFSNINSKLPTTLSVDTNGSPSVVDRTLTVHSGITLQDTTTTVAVRGNNGVLTYALGANNTFHVVNSSAQLSILDNVLVTGAFSIEKTGAGSLLMGVGKTYSGGLILTEGRLRTNGSSVQSGGVITGSPFGTGTLTLRGGTLQAFGTTSRTYHNSILLDGNVTLGGLNPAGDTQTAAQTFSTLGGGSTTVSAGTRTLNIQSAVTWNQDIDGDGALVKTGPATLTLAGGNGFTGGLTIAEGVVSVGSATALGSSAASNTTAVTVNGGTLRFTAATARSGANRGFRVGSSVGTIEVETGVEARLQGGLRDVVSEVGVLRKTGPGTLSMEGVTNSFTGGTLVEAGTLRLNGNTFGGVGGAGLAVSTGATLEGSGTINGASTFADGSTIRLATYDTTSTTVPNPITNPVATFTFNNNLTLGAATLHFDLDGTATSDRIDLASGAVLDIGSGLFDLDNLVINPLSGFGEGTYTLISTNTTVVGTAGSNLTGTIGGFTVNLALGNGGQTLDLVVTSAIPEPSAFAALAGLGMLAFAAARRRRA